MANGIIIYVLNLNENNTVDIPPSSISIVDN